MLIKWQQTEVRLLHTSKAILEKREMLQNAEALSLVVIDHLKNYSVEDLDAGLVMVSDELLLPDFSVLQAELLTMPLRLEV